MKQIYPLLLLLFCAKKVQWLTFNYANTPFAVPANKQFVIVNAENFYTGPTPQTPGCNVLLNGVPYSFDTPVKVPMFMNSILDAGMTLSTSGCTGNFTFVINGYLMDK